MHEDQGEPAAVVCPKCHGPTRVLMNDVFTEPAELRCTQCDWKAVGRPKQGAVIDWPRVADRKTINRMLAHTWRETTMICSQCRGEIIGRWSPSSTAPKELLCKRCGRRII